MCVMFSELSLSSKLPTLNQLRSISFGTRTLGDEAEFRVGNDAGCGHGHLLETVLARIARQL